MQKCIEMKNVSQTDARMRCTIKTDEIQQHFIITFVLASEIEIGLSSFSDDHRGLSYFAAARAT